MNPSHFFLKLSMSASSSVRPYDKSLANISGTFGVGGLFVPNIASSIAGFFLKELAH